MKEYEYLRRGLEGYGGGNMNTYLCSAEYFVDAENEEEAIKEFIDAVKEKMASVMVELEERN